MILPINEDYRIISDSNQWIIQVARTRKGKTDWEHRYYFVTIESAVKALGELMVRRSNAETLADALLAVNEIATMLSQALTPTIDGLSKLEKSWEIPE